MSHPSWDNSKSGASARAVTYADACSQTVAPAPGVPVAEFTTFAPVIEYIAPAPAVTYVVPSQQLPPVFFTAAVATDVNFDITGLVSSQFSGAAVEASAPQVVGSLPLLEVFTEPVCNPVHQELFAASEMTENIVGNLCCARTCDRSGNS